MTVTCDVVRRAFGEFQCCPTSCHEPIVGPTRQREYNGLCCAADRKLHESGVSVYFPPTHPALLRAIEEQDDRR